MVTVVHVQLSIQIQIDAAYLSFIMVSDDIQCLDYTLHGARCILEGGHSEHSDNEQQHT